ncbi:anaphase-promoting complex, cyclosome, subunit 4-domain-containing protein [Dipodascopsis tothii]|uniref:anaphase-promoting complex, cyclosome, subunit 4-domain-containing protein n=1 Tax=Dipodascopsis tothii TaxID=44089 RepID=UPI0034CDB31A
MATQPGTFRSLAEKTLPFAALDRLVTWCPTMDLMTFAAGPAALCLFRMNGQQLWRLALKDKDVEITQVAWRPDGKVLAVGCTDGTSRIVDVNNGRVVHVVTTATRVSGLNWVAQAGTHGRGTVLGLDTAGRLPRLSVLPTASAPDSIFTSKVLVNDIINETAQADETPVDLLFTANADGPMFLNLFGLFSVSGLAIPGSFELDRPVVVAHTSTPDLAVVGLLVRTAGSVVHVPMYVHFIRRFGLDLVHLATAYTRLQGLLAYARDAALALEHDWRALSAAAATHVDALAAALGPDDGSAELMLYEALVTGVPGPAVHAWMKDQLGERGLRAWRKVAVASYDSLRRLVLEHLLPCCDRIAVIVTDLRGLARWRQRGAALGLVPDSFTAVLDTLAEIVRKLHRLVWELNREADGARAFAEWLKYLFEEIAAIEGAQPTEDPAAPTIETKDVAEFVSEHLFGSRLRQYFDPAAATAAAAAPPPPPDAYTPAPLPRTPSAYDGSTLLAMMAALRDVADTAFGQPTAEMKKHTTFGVPTRLAGGDAVVAAMRTLTQADAAVSHAALLDPAAPSTLTLARLVHPADAKAPHAPAVDKTTLAFAGERVLAAEFADDHKLMVLLAADKPTEAAAGRLVSLAYDDTAAFRPPAAAAPALGLAGTPDGFVYDLSAPVPAAEPPALVQERVFGEDFAPVAFAINGEPGRRVGLVLSDDRQRYMVFHLDDDDDDDDMAE